MFFNAKNITHNHKSKKDFQKLITKHIFCTKNITKKGKQAGINVGGKFLIGFFWYSKCNKRLLHFY